MNRRDFSRLAAAATLLSPAMLVRAENYPARPVRLIVPYPPGGGTDTLARAVFERVGPLLGQPFVIENKGGAGTTIGLGELARAKADGYTVGVGGSSDPLLPLLYDKLSFNPVSDLSFVSTLATVPIVLVAGPAMPATNLGELLAMARARKGTPIHYASPGTASPHHLAGIYFSEKAGLPLTHVPYKGTSPAITDLLGGHVPLAMLGLPSALPLVREGKVKILGVATPRRSALAPEIPTLSESGVPGFSAGYWWHVTVPSGTPNAVILKLRETIDQVLRTPALHDSLLAAGFEPMLLSPAEAERALKEDTAKWTKVIRENNIRGG
ncbi:MAG: Bug family tripartite tricarboxylate transporter substrate binding protein [Hydrogenophaga sp.]|uniref:Bug family tripartite tricarboxylate transporter substrate binding protein n=1 Tax=Hydrogenophaga sp. TaxID=1904254 RepID=UPI0040359F10